jgi:hypothetical protein
MKNTTLKKLQEFIGQVCTIITTATCKNDFTDVQFPDFFLGIVESIDEDGVFSKHPVTKCVNFYSWPHIVGIFQEQVIQKNDPQYEEVIKEIKSSPPQQGAFMPINMDESPFVNPDLMAEIAKQASENQSKMLQKKNN